MSHVPVEFDPEAIAEAKEAFHWYAKRSQRAADGFIAELTLRLLESANSRSYLPATCMARVAVY